MNDNSETPQQPEEDRGTIDGSRQLRNMKTDIRRDKKRHPYKIH